MDPTNGKSQVFERRTSTRQSVRISAAAGDDDFALAAMGISDGFRPSQEQPQSSSSSGTATTPSNESPLPPVNVPQQNTETTDTQPSSSPPARPSSIAKTRPNESFSLRHDGQMGPITEAAMPRASTSWSVNPFIAAEELPYTGPSGPSFPYQMYPQNVRSNRTDSVATTSTAAPIVEGQYNCPRGPTHPYGMYPQNTAAGGGGCRAIMSQPQAIPVGFPGATDQYRRRIGPEGDYAADLIGPLGHTEELPPYTRYPDEAYARKTRDAGQPPREAAAPILPIPAQPAMQVQNNAAATMQPEQQSNAATSPAPISITTSVPTIIPGAGGIGLATRNPEFSTSTDDLGSARSRFSAQSFGSQTSSHEIDTAAAAVTINEKEQPRWKQKARKKLWGIIPYWAICLVFSVLILVGIILGAVIGTLLTKHKLRPHKDHEAEVSPYPATVTVTLDATPLSTAPANLRPLEGGDFALPIVAASRSSKSCFNNTLQSNAWSCRIVFSQLMMRISRLENNSNTSDYAINLSCNRSLTLNANTFSYGTQPPCFNENRTMELVTDIYEQNRGPAWFFQMPYQKVVILPESFLSVDDSPPITTTDSVPLKERFLGDDSFPGGGDFQHKEVASPGEKPWICTWGGTILEVFIFANQDSNSYRGYTSLSAMQASHTATATGNPVAHGSPSLLPTPYPSGNPMSQDEPDGSVHILSTDGAKATVTATTTITNPIESQTTDLAASTTYGQWDMDGPNLPPPTYPRVVKIEERRVNGPPSEIPVCQQFEITESGRKPVIDANGNNVIIEIGETEPAPTPVKMNDLFPAETTSPVSKKRTTPRKRTMVDPKTLEKRTGGAYYLDEQGHIRERDSGNTILVGQDLSNCGCLWWTL